ncbi:MAG: hypothetical protein HY925_15030 [Elusimicrobia bacterium]|nr:hypothetical protein [Elusimicrobiota bacterium]
MTLGNDRTFHDRLSWLLTIPVGCLAGGAAYLAFLALEVATEGDAVGSAEWWIGPLRAAACGFALVRVGASVAPYRKAAAGAVLALVYGAWATRSFGLSVASAFAWSGAAAACFLSRGLKDDSESAAAEKA